MKNNKKSSAQPLSKKQRKKLEKSGVNLAGKAKMPREKKWLISLIAAICVLSIACASFGSILLARALDGVFDDPTKSVYELIKLSKHLDTKGIGSDFYTGTLLDLSETANSDDYKPLTMADVERYILEERIPYRTLKKQLQRTTPVGLSDTVAFYVTDLFLGEPKTAEEEAASRLTIPSNLTGVFGTYTSYTTLVIGMAGLGADFDEKIVSMNVSPDMTWRELRESGKIAISDTVCMGLAFFKSKGESSTPYADEAINRYSWESSTVSKYTKNGERVDLDADLDERLSAALVENCKAIGEQFTFVLEDYNLTGDNANADYKVMATIYYVLEEEQTVDITFTFDDTYFTEEAGDFYDLNGKTVTMRTILVYTDDCDLPEFNRDFIVNTLKADIKATDDAGAVAEYKEKKLASLNESIEKSKEEALRLAAITYFVNRAVKTESYLSSNANSADIANSAQAYLSRRLFENFIRDRHAVPSTDEMSDYVSSIGQAYQIDVSTADEYVSYLYSAQGEQLKRTELLTYHIFDEENMKITDAMLDEAYNAYLDRLVAAMWDAGTYNKEYIVNLLGEDQIKSWVRRDLVYQMVGDFLMENNVTKAN